MVSIDRCGETRRSGAALSPAAGKQQNAFLWQARGLALLVSKRRSLRGSTGFLPVAGYPQYHSSEWSVQISSPLVAGGLA